MGVTEYGLLKIGNENDRLTVASILFKNGYSVFPARKKKDGKSYEYYVEFEMRPRDLNGSERSEG